MITRVEKASASRELPSQFLSLIFRTCSILGRKSLATDRKNTPQFFSLIFRTFYPKLKRGGVHFCVDCEETPAERRASSQSTQKRTPPIQQTLHCCRAKIYNCQLSGRSSLSITVDHLFWRSENLYCPDPILKQLTIKDIYM
jgi:hypothetical protein